jgi:hypothetical protein
MWLDTRNLITKRFQASSKRLLTFSCADILKILNCWRSISLTLLWRCIIESRQIYCLRHRSLTTRLTWERFGRCSKVFAPAILNSQASLCKWCDCGITRISEYSMIVWSMRAIASTWKTYWHRSSRSSDKCRKTSWTKKGLSLRTSWTARTQNQGTTSKSPICRLCLTN